MCGRFARYSLSRELERFFNAQPPDFEIYPNYNVTPTQEIPVIVQHEDARHIKKSGGSGKLDRNVFFLSEALPG